MPTTEPHPSDRAEERLLPWPQVREIVGLSRTTTWRLQNEGLFPLPVQVSANRVAWRETEIEAWCAARAPRSGPSHFPVRRPTPKPRGSRPLPEQPIFAAPAPTPAAGSEPTVPLQSPRPRPTAPRRSRNRRPDVAEGQIAFDF